MSASSSSANHWKWRALAVVPLLLLSLGPQIHFWLERGSQWHGAFATHHADEFLYAGYVNALADGRPRRNDPFTGRDDRLPETAFSIQVVPAFVLSSIAKICGASATFILLAAAAGLLASLAVFWLLSSITGDHRLAAAGVLFVLLTGTIFAGQGLIGVVLKLDIVSLGLPFLRRYQPAAMFFVFFIFCTFMWQALTAHDLRRARLKALAAGLSLAMLVFSYLYLWSAALAWVVCLGLLWLWLRPAGQKRQGIEVFAIVSVMFALAVVPYAYLVSNRSRTLDELQTLISTHRPDLFRIPEIIGLLIVVILVVSVKRNKIQRSDPRVIFAGSFAVLPVAVFNQQVITGRSMQPFHFEAFIVNYVVLVGVVILAGLLWRNISRNTLLWVAALCILLGAVEVYLQAAAFARTDTTKDEMIPVLKRLDQLPAQNGSPNLVFSPYLELNQILPTWTRHGTLLAIGSIDFGSASHDERKQFLYTHLYYSGADAERLRALFNNIPEELGLSYYVKYAVFGHERVRPLYALHFHPLTQDEIEAEVAAYVKFVESFSQEQALQRPLKYAIADDKFNFSRVEQWYERDAGERTGAFTLYRLRPRE